MCLALALAGLLAAGAPGSARADRPYLAVTTAAGEDDDERSVELSATLQQSRGGTRAWALGAEYHLDPRTSFEIGSTRAGATQGVSFGAKRLFNSYVHDDWAWGLAVEAGTTRTRGSGRTAGAVALALPLSWQLRKGLQLHASLGVEQARGETAERLLAAGADWQLLPRLTLFAEAAREGDATLAHGGVRLWLRRERVAVDLSTLRRREDAGPVQRGWVIGLALMDL